MKLSNLSLSLAGLILATLAELYPWPGAGRAGASQPRDHQQGTKGANKVKAVLSKSLRLTTQLTSSG